MTEPSDQRLPTPGARRSVAPSASLPVRLRDRIRVEGAITFAAFMEAALYDADEGYYASAPVGESGDFVTSPHVSPAFGILAARLIDDLWTRLGRPDPFLLAEAGAGDGTLARRLLPSLPDELAAVTTFVAAERGAAGRAKLADLITVSPAMRMVTVLDDLGSLASASPGSGVLLANELFDNLPFHRLRGTREAPVELRVAVQEGAAQPDGFRFVLVETPAPDDLIAIAPHMRPGQEAAVSPAAIGVIEQASRLLRQGYLILFDYAADANGTVQVHGYRRHRVEEDVLSAPGSRDITAGVDLSALTRHAAAAGHRVWGPISQRDALMHLGFRDLSRVMRNRQTDALDAGRGREAIRTYSARNRADLLVDPSGLGGFAVLCIGFGDVTRPDLLLDGEGDDDDASLRRPSEGG